MYYKAFIPLLILIILGFSSISQDYSVTYGTITNDELKMTSYEKDTTAEAVILYDIGETKFIDTGDGLDLLFKESKKIKVLKESYIDKAEYSIRVHKGKTEKEHVNNLKLVVYNFEDGKLVATELQDKNIFTENVNEYYDQIKFAAPNVKVGSVIEFQYELQSPFYTNLKDWYFQDLIPTRYSKYTVKMVPFFTYQMRLQGAGAFDEKKSYEDSGLERNYYGIKYRDMIHEFILKDIPAFEIEKYITSIWDYIIKLDFQLSVVYTTDGATIKYLKDWESLIKELLKYHRYEKYIKNSAKHYSTVAKQKKLFGKDQKEQVNIIVNDIKKSYSWNEVRSKFPDNLNSFLSKKTGDCSEVNLYLTGALRSVDIQAYPVIISTRDNGKIVRNYPFLDQFNYVLVYANINNKWGLYDATDPFYPSNKIPENCINDIGLVINKNDVLWVKLKESSNSVSQYNMICHLSDDHDKIIAKTSFKTTGYDAAYYRKKFKNKVEDIEKYLEENNLNIEGEITTNNYSDVTKAYQIDYTISKQLNVIGDKIFLNPFFDIPFDDNPFKQKKRNYPIDMVYPNSTLYFSEITIPEGYSVEKLPEDFSFDSKLVLIQYKAQKSKNKVIIQGTYQFKKSVYPAEDYSRIKHYFNLIIEKFNQKIILVEKK